MTSPILPDPQARSAGPAVFYGQLCVLASRHDVTLATLDDQPESREQALNAISALGVTCRTVPLSLAKRTRSDIRIRQGLEWLRSDYPLRTIWFHTPAMQQVISELAAEQPFDVVHVADNAMSAYRYPAQIPVLLTENDVRHPAPAREWKELGPLGAMDPIRERLNEAEQQRWKRYQINVWSGSDRIQVFANRDAHNISVLAPGLATRVTVNPFGIDLPVNGYSQHEEPDTLVFVGNFLHRPNVDSAIWAAQHVMPLLRSSVPGVRLRIIGASPPETVRRLAQPDIQVFRDVAAVEPYVESASIFLAPIRSGGGMRLKVVKAMALGKPVVTTRLGIEGLRSVGAEPPVELAETSNEFADAIVALLHSRERRLNIGARARAFVERHLSWQAHGDRMEGVLCELYDRTRLERSRVS